MSGVANGLELAPGSDGGTLMGLVVTRFDGNGILVASDVNVVTCSYIGLTLSVGRVGARQAFASQATGHDIGAAPAQKNDFDLSRNTITVTEQAVPADCGRPWKFESTGIKDLVLTGGESRPFAMLTSGRHLHKRTVDLRRGTATTARGAAKAGLTGKTFSSRVPALSKRFPSQ